MYEVFSLLFWYVKKYIKNVFHHKMSRSLFLTVTTRLRSFDTDVWASLPVMERAPKNPPNVPFNPYQSRVSERDGKVNEKRKMAFRYSNDAGWRDVVYVPKGRYQWITPKREPFEIKPRGSNSSFTFNLGIYFQLFNGGVLEKKGC